MRDVNANDKETWFCPIDYGPDALRVRLAMVERAQRTIDAQYYIWNLDRTGSLLLERILAAAERGVRVRMLIDDTDTAGENRKIIAADVHPNVQLRTFNPFSTQQDNMLLRWLANLPSILRLNHRMHNKAFIVDDRTAVVGGRNIADEYFGYGRHMNFRDFDLVFHGPPVDPIRHAFEAYWDSDWASPPRVRSPRPDRARLRTLKRRIRRRHDRSHAAILKDMCRDQWRQDELPLPAERFDGDWQVLVDAPDVLDGDSLARAGDRLQDALDDAREEVMIITPYFTPTEDFMEGLDRWRRRGVRVRMLTNSLASTDFIPAHCGFRPHRRDLLDMGVELHELHRNAANRSHHEAPDVEARIYGLHAKVMVIDCRIVYVGSLNLDPRSFFLNTELGVLVRSPNLAARVAADFEPDFGRANSWQVQRDNDGGILWVHDSRTLHRQPAGNPWRRIADFLLGFLPMESQL